MAREGKSYVLTDEESIVFCNFIRTERHPERNLAIYELTRRAGLRIGEVSKLKLSDVLDTEGEIKTVATLGSSITKGGKVREAYFTSPTLRSALSNYLSVRPKYKNDALFINQKGNPFDGNTLSRAINRLYRKAGFQDATSHGGRRGAASSLLSKGLDIVSLSRFLGHKDIKTTQEYIEIDQSKLMKAVQVV